MTLLASYPVLGLIAIILIAAFMLCLIFSPKPLLTLLSIVSVILVIVGCHLVLFQGHFGGIVLMCFGAVAVLMLNKSRFA